MNLHVLTARILIMTVLFGGIENGARYALEPWNSELGQAKIERQIMDETIDTLFIGSSMSYRGIDPMIIDEKLGTTSFNLGTAVQPFMGCYYLLRDADETNPVKNVYLIMSITLLKKKKVEDAAYIAGFDNMTSTRWKIEYAKDVIEWGACPQKPLLYLPRVKTLLSIAQIKENIEKKKDLERAETYTGRGYRPNNKIYDGNNEEPLSWNYNWDKEEGDAQVTEQAEAYLKLIGDYCKDNNIKLTLIQMPLAQDFIDKAGYVDGYNQYLEKKAEEMNAGLINFLLYKDYKKVFTDNMFFDRRHLNSEGAIIASNIIAQIEKGEIKEDSFYKSMDEFKKKK